MEPPYKLVLARISSPAFTILSKALKMAAIPEAQAIEESPFSYAVFRFSKAVIVGLFSLVYENPFALL